MNKLTLSLAVLALIGNSDAMSLVKKQQVSADDFDDDVDTTQKIAAVQIENQKNDGTTQETAEGLSSDAQMYGGTQSIKASNSTANATKQNFDQMFESGEKELNVALKAEKMNTENTKSKRDNIDAAMNESEDRKRRFNTVDGLYHNDDGTISTVDGQVVPQNVQLEASGKTKHHQKKKTSHKQVKKSEKHHHQELAQHKSKAKSKDSNEQDDEDNIAEGESRTKEVEGAKVEQKENERKEAVIKEEERQRAEFKAEFNEHDGLRHKKDGTVTEIDGTKVNGANHGINYTQKNATKSGHHSKHHKKHHHIKHHHGHKKNKTAEAKPVAATQVKIDEKKDQKKHHHAKKHHHNKSKKQEEEPEKKEEVQLKQAAKNKYSKKDDKMEEEE